MSRSHLNGFFNLYADLKKSFPYAFDRLTEIEALKRFLVILIIAAEISVRVDFFPSVSVLFSINFIRSLAQTAIAAPKTFCFFFFEAEAKLYDIEKGLSYLLYIGITPTQR